MGELLQRIKYDMSHALKTGDESTKKALRIIIGETGRLKKKAGEEATDDEVVKIVKALIEGEKTLLQQTGANDVASLSVYKEYLPEMVDETEIEQWIRNNVNFAELKNKLQAVKPTIAQFGSRVDGEIVKRIITEKF